MIGDWDAEVIVGGVDVSAYMSGQCMITQEGDAAWLAEFEFTPPAAYPHVSLDGLEVQVSITADRGQVPIESRRAFTGKVATWSYSAGQRLFHVTAKNDYQEVVKACAAAADVEALFSGLNFGGPVAGKVVTWSSNFPDPTSYFSALMSTVQASACCDEFGDWWMWDWWIQADAPTNFSDSDIFDGTFDIQGADKSGLPSSIEAKLIVRMPRLYAASVAVTWTGLDYVTVGRGRGSWPSVSSIQSALDGASGWLIKGTPTFTHPEPGYTIPLEGGGSAAMVVASPDTIAIGLSATAYTRWYQEVDVTYTVSIALGGLADPDKSINASISSSFDSGAWESEASAITSTGIYAANAPVVETPPTGYEGLSGPWPAENTGFLYTPDITAGELAGSVTHIAARAVRSAAAGKRNRRVIFETFVNPDWMMAETVSAAADGVTAVGQVTYLKHVMDFDNGSAITQFEVACPAADAGEPAMTCTPDALDGSDSLVLAAPVLGNFVGYDTTTITYADDVILGSLSNTTAGATGYDNTKPAYITQFRIALPEIPAEKRDPAGIDVPVSVTYSISGGSLEVTL